MATETITVKVLYFGIVQEIFGLAEKIDQMPVGSTLETLIDQHARHPRFRQYASFFRYAINQKMVDHSSPAQVQLKDQDCIAVIPPISGG
jgi:molybdopterin converting factor small subunit